MFFKPQALHFTGIGGIGMSGLAEICLAAGCPVSGSDLKPSAVTERLAALGARVEQGHRAENLGEAEALVATSAAAYDNPELAEARRRGLPIVRRGELLAELMRQRTGIAMAGSHGKTTTTAMAAAIALHAGLDPTVAVGGRLPELGGATARLGRGRHLIAESDESDGSFLELAPVVSVITNVDREHLDHYGSFEKVREAFAQFANRTAFYGTVVLCADDAEASALEPGIRRRVLRYGRGAAAELRIGAETGGAEGSSFTLAWRGADLGEFRLGVVGAHSVLNAAAAAGAALSIGVEPDMIRGALAAYRGVARRLELKGRAAGVTVVDDYGHHPTEIRATLAALRRLKPGRLAALFQPHRYTRTRDLMDEFADCFSEADLVRVTELYPASEAPIAGVSGEALAARLGAAGHPDARYAGPLEDAARSLARELRPGDLALTLGAGSVTQAGAWILESLKE
jgi:UDP-N-acetylmuramate--alanine ligase